MTWLDNAPRIQLAHLPTPLEPLDRLSEALGGPRIWIKRDDCTGLGTGGNKTRKLEFLLGEALAAGARAVVTFGAVQSNHARQTAAACAVVGLPCHLLLARKVSWADKNYDTLGNVLLDELFGADVRLLAPPDVDAEFRALREKFQPGELFVIPVGGSNATGATGYAACVGELISQVADAGIQPTELVHATSSAGTQSGLLAGLCHHQLDTRIRVHGVNVSEPDPGPLKDTIAALAGEVLARHDPDRHLSDDVITIDSDYLGAGYGLPTELTLEAVRTLAALEGVLLDPVYSGKAMGALMDRVRKKEFESTSDLLFLHTGGSAALPVYRDVLLSAPGAAT